MIYDKKLEKIVLADGEQIHAFRGIIGISPTGDVTEGFDGTFCFSDTPEARREIARVMIDRWYYWGVASDDELTEEAAIQAAETGADREQDYDAERYAEAYIAAKRGDGE